MNERSAEPRPDAPDEQTGRLLDEWLQDEAPAHEPPVLVPTVRARIAFTRRRPGWLIRDWWRWRPGRTDRRFPRMNTAMQLAAVAVLALSGVGLVMTAGGPAADPGQPAAVADLDPEEIVAKVTGSLAGSSDEIETVTEGAYAAEHRGLTGKGVVIADDPRLGGKRVEVTWNFDDFTPQDLDGAALKSMAMRIWSEEGAWEGVMQGIRYPEEKYGDSHTAGLLTGSGIYEGQSAYLIFEGASHDYTFEGLIFPGEMLE